MKKKRFLLVAVIFGGSVLGALGCEDDDWDLFGSALLPTAKTETSTALLIFGSNPVAPTNRVPFFRFGNNEFYAPQPRNPSWQYLRRLSDSGVRMLRYGPDASNPRPHFNHEVRGPAGNQIRNDHYYPGELIRRTGVLPTQSGFYREF